MLDVSLDGGRQCLWQRAPRIPRGSPGSSPSSRGGSSDRGNDQSSMCLTVMRASHNSHRSAHEGRGLWLKINLPIFKDEKTKDAVTYHSWWWDMAIFHCLVWDDRHLLSYIFQSLQGFLCNLARSLGEDATLSDILQMWDEHYDIVMMFDTLSKELYSLKQGLGENVAEFRVCLLQQVQILQSEYPGRILPEYMEGDEVRLLLWGP